MVYVMENERRRKECTRYHSDDIAASKHGIDYLEGDMTRLRSEGKGANVEVVPLHVEVLLHSRDICIVYIGSVKVWYRSTMGKQSV